MRARKFLLGAAGLAVLVVGGWLLLNQRPAAGHVTKDTDPVAGVAVETVRAKLEDVPIYLTGLGTVQPFNSVLVRARIDGQIEKILFKEGQDVRRGDILAEIDPLPLDAQLRQALAQMAKDQAQLDNARVDLNRYSDSIHRGAVSVQLLDTAKAQTQQLAAQVQADSAALEATRVQRNYATIKAPIDGRTGARLVDEGNLVHANDTMGIVLINQIHPIAVVFSLPADRLADIQVHAKDGELQVRAQRRDASRAEVTGKLVLVDNQIDQATGTIKLKGEFANEDLALWPGQFVDAKLLLETRKHVVTIPTTAIQSGPNGTFVFAVKSGHTVEQRKIDVLVSDVGTSAIGGGLNAGDEVVTEGAYKLEAGTTVRVLPASSIPAP